MAEQPLGHQSVSRCRWDVCSPWPSFLASTPGIFLAWDREYISFFPPLASWGSQRPGNILPRSLTETSITLPRRGPWSSVDHALSRVLKPDCCLGALSWPRETVQHQLSGLSRSCPQTLKHHLPASPSHWGSIEFTGLEMGRGSRDTFLSSSVQNPPASRAKKYITK